MLSLLLGGLALSGQLSFVVAAAARSKPIRQRRSPATIPMHEIELELGSDHPLARRQDDYGLRGGPRTNYYVDISFAGGTTSVIFDTGSADLVINSNSVPSESTAPTSLTCSERYGSASSSQSGDIESTSYGFAGFSTNGYFCRVADLPVNGIMGFHYPRSGPNGVSGQTGQNPQSQFHAQGLSAFGVYIANYPQGGGAFTPNDWDPQFLYDGDDATFMDEPVNSQGGGFWGVDLTGNFEYEGASYPLGQSRAFVDTGTPYIVMPQAAVQQIWQLVGADPNTGSYGSNCDPGGDPITFVTANGNRLDIPAFVYVVKQADGTCLNAFRPKTAQGTANNPFIVWGAAFLRAYYTYFDIDNAYLGFAINGG